MRRFKCDVCEKEFTWKSNLFIHTRVPHQKKRLDKCLLTAVHSRIHATRRSSYAALLYAANDSLQARLRHFLGYALMNMLTSRPQRACVCRRSRLKRISMRVEIPKFRAHAAHCAVQHGRSTANFSRTPRCRTPYLANKAFR